MKKGFIILFILTLFLEIFVFNYKSYRVLSSKNEIEFSKKDFSLVEQTDEYKYVEIENIDEEVKTLHIFLDNVTNGTKYEVFYTDETSSGFRYLGTKNYAKNVWKSTYLDTYLSGKSNKMGIKIYDPNASIEKININEKIPFEFNIYRFIILYFILVSIYAIKKGSIFKVPYLQNNFKQEIVLFTVLAVFSILIVYINTYSEEVEIKKDTKLKREEELSLIDTDNTKGSTEVEKIKLNILDLDNKIKETSTNIFKINENLIELSNKKTLLMERIKYDKESSEVQNNLIVLKDREGSINNLISSLKFDIGNLKNNKNDLDTKVNDNNFVYKEVLNEREKVNFELNNERKKLIETKNKIDILESNISNMSKIPYAVKAIVGNPTLRGIHDIIANVISTEREYSVMLDIALGASANNIITNDEACAKEAIEYLKSHNKGRATFFPLNVIKPKSVDPETLKSVSNIVGFVGIASDLVTYDTKYYNIVMNQLGNIIVAKDITTAIQISKKINHRYRVISLDGEIIHVGGIMTGGSVKSNNSYITDKYELERLKISIDNINNNIKELDVKLDSKDKELDIIKNKNYSINIEIIKVNEEINNKVTLLRDKVSELESINNEIKNLTDESLDNELNNIINEYYENEKLKNEQEKLLDKYNNDKNELNISLNDLETAIKKSNQEYISLKNEISSLEIDITKLNMNLDNLLNRLNEDYNLGYERARNEYTLEIEENIAREKVSNLRRKIKSLGDVNLGSIDEYDRIYKRVTFLTKQKEDLEKSQSDLLNIIDDMDNVMKDKFVTSFNNINTEFGKVFNTLFKGGSAHLELTDPDNIFETGIDIIAVPPGKNKKPLSLLSGGERTMTAISLLFSIMNLEKVPFVILDEVESALDENNATIYGEYLDNYKNKTQLLVITHKKKTMEFLDKLYGITMQESGVSKIVSVKLED